MSTTVLLRVSFVCTGNICRSPMGDVVFRAMAERAGVGDRFAVTSRGTHGYHVGGGADPRTVAALAAAGYDGRAHRAAQVSPADIAGNDLLVALDRGHERLALLTAFDPEAPADPDVFDPYYSDERAFARVLEQIERSCAALLESTASEM